MPDAIPQPAPARVRHRSLSMIQHLSCAAAVRLGNLRHELSNLGRDRRGVTALEYGLIAAVGATVIVTAFTSFGTALTGLFTGIASRLAIS